MCARLSPPGSHKRVRSARCRSSKKLKATNTPVVTGVAATSPSVAVGVPTTPGSPALTLKDKVSKIRHSLGLDDTLVMISAIEEANKQMGLSGEGTLPAQVEELCRMVGV